MTGNTLNRAFKSTYVHADQKQEIYFTWPKGLFLIRFILILLQFLILQPFVQCSDPGNQPFTNVVGETYGTGSRCLQHGQVWTRTSVNGGSVISDDDNGLYGSGCYQVSVHNYTPVGI